MNKKLLISLSSLATIAIVAPVLVITSCSGETPIIVNLNITAKINPNVTETDITTLEGNDLPAQLIALQKLFDGSDLNAENQTKFSILVNKGQRVVTLTAKTGYTINGGSALASNEYTIGTAPTVTDLKITAKANPKITKEDVTTLKGTNLPAQLIALKKLFDGPGLTSENQANFKVAVDETKEIVTLNANTGFTINDKSSFDSNKYTIEPTVENINLEITAITTSVSLTEAEVANLEGQNNNNKLTVLKRLFSGTGLTPANLANFDVTVDKTSTTVTLTAKPGFTIGGQNSLKSTAYTLIMNLDISQKANPSLTYSDIANLDGSNSNVSDATKLVILNKVFEGNGLATVGNLNKFTIAINKGSRTVTLNARSGNTIAGTNSISSNPYAINLDVRVKSGTGIIIIDQSDINNLNSNFNNTAKLNSLQKLFDGSDLTTTRLADFNISVNTSTKKVTLNPKANFIIDGKPRLESNEFGFNLDIRAKSATINLNQSELLNLDWDDQNAKLATLKKIFEGSDLTLGNLNNFNINIIRITVNASVDLIAKTGYTFSGQQTRTKQVNLPSIINASIAPIIGLATLSREEENILNQPTTSSNINAQIDILIKNQLFSGIGSTNRRFFKISINTTTRIVTLEAKPGYVFGTSPSSTKTTIFKNYI
ncbi:MAG: hypothetical protein ACRDAW_01400 [Metamycoplasmataceae bacterium]